MAISKSLILKMSLFVFVLVCTQQTVFAINPYDAQVTASTTRIDATNMGIAHNKQGIVYMEKGYPLHAIDEFKLGIMTNPNSTMSATLYNNLGRSYEMIRAYDNAIASYQHAIKINPDFALYYKNLINAYKAKNAIKKAQNDYEKIVKINSQDAQAYFILSLIYIEQENKNEAIKALNKFLSLEPKLELAGAAKKYLTKLGGSTSSSKK